MPLRWATMRCTTDARGISSDTTITGNPCEAIDHAELKPERALARRRAPSRDHQIALAQAAAQRHVELRDARGAHGLVVVGADAREFLVDRIAHRSEHRRRARASRRRDVEHAARARDEVGRCGAVVARDVGQVSRSVLDATRERVLGHDARVRLAVRHSGNLVGELAEVLRAAGGVEAVPRAQLGHDREHVDVLAVLGHGAHRCEDEPVPRVGEVVGRERGLHAGQHRPAALTVEEHGTDHRALGLVIGAGLRGFEEPAVSHGAPR